MLKLVDFYVGRSVESLIECKQLIGIIEQLLADSLGKVKNLVNLYSIVATKVLSLTLDEESEKKLGTELFVNFINTLSNSAQNMNTSDAINALRTNSKLFNYLTYKKDFLAISRCYFSYFKFVFSLVGSPKLARFDLSEAIACLVTDLTTISQDP